MLCANNTTWLTEHRKRVSVIPFRFLVHLICHIFLMFPAQITGIPALRDQGMPFSHPFRASAGATEGNCSNVQGMIKENAWNNLEVVQTTAQSQFSQLLSDFGYYSHCHQQYLGDVITPCHPKSRRLFLPTSARIGAISQQPLVSFPGLCSVHKVFLSQKVGHSLLTAEFCSRILILLLNPSSWSRLFFLISFISLSLLY